MDQLASTLIRRRLRPPFSGEEVARLVALGNRLKGELGMLVERLPIGVRQARAAGRYLQVDRNITQRILAVTASADEGMEVLARLPGVRGIRQFVAGAAKQRVPESDISTAMNAVDSFDREVKELGGSHARLVARIRATQAMGSSSGQGEGDPTLRSRELLHHAAMEFVGRRLDVYALVAIRSRRTADPSLNEFALGSALIGHQARADSSPLALSFQQDGDDHAAQASNEQREQPSEWLIREFSSNPIPFMVGRDLGADTRIQVLDPVLAGDGRKLDIAVGWKPGPDPLSRRVPVLGHGAGIRHPSQRLVFDTYIHRSLAMACVPSLRVYQRPPDPLIPLARQWYQQLPGAPRLQLLGPGLEQAGSDAWAHHARFTRYMFDRVRLKPEEFIGFRCDLRYPVWGLVYFMAFDFSTASSD